MQPCKGGAAERHNKRDKELDYIRKDLTPLNCYKEWTSIEAQMKHIRAEYEPATGQRLQSTAQPIQEIVLVIDKDTTPEQVEKFCELTKSLGMTPLSYAIHKDEGHKDAETGEWVPNYHAHVIVDTTCWEHRKVERTKKKNGKNVIDPQTKKPVKILVDAYAKTIKFSREDMSRLQDFAAEATGLERGVSSDRVHEEARQYKAHEQAREIARQAKAIEEQKALLEEQGKTIEEQKAAAAAQDQILRTSIGKMQEQGKDVVKNFDEQHNKIAQSGIAVDKGLLKWRNWLDRTSREDLSDVPVSRIIQLAQPLSNAITIVAMAAASIACALLNSLAQTVKEKEKMLAALTRQIKEQSVWKSTKGAVLSFLDKPANKQAEGLVAEVAAAKSEAEQVKKESAEKTRQIRGLEEEVSQLREDNARKTASLRNFASSLEKERSANATLRGNVANLQSQLEKKDGIIKRCMQSLTKTAETLVDHANQPLLQRFEARGVHKCIGESIWNHAKETKDRRLAELIASQQREKEEGPRKGGMHL